MLLLTLAGLVGCKGPPPAERTFASEQAVFEELLARVDADGDGRISLAEYRRLDADGPFESLDADKDGSLDSQELQGAFLGTDPGSQRIPDLNRPPEAGRGPPARPGGVGRKGAMPRPPE